MFSSQHLESIHAVNPFSEIEPRGDFRQTVKSQHHGCQSKRNDKPACNNRYQRWTILSKISFQIGRPAEDPMPDNPCSLTFLSFFSPGGNSHRRP